MPARPSGRSSVKMKMYGEEEFTLVTAAAAIAGREILLSH